MKNRSVVSTCIDYLNGLSSGVRIWCGILRSDSPLEQPDLKNERSQKRINLTPFCDFAHCRGGKCKKSDSYHYNSLLK